MTSSGDAATRVVLVGGHESHSGADLVRFERIVPHAVACAPGRHLQRHVNAALAEDAHVVVVPMTFGRNPTMVADAARTLRWLAAPRAHLIAMASPFGTPDHLVALLRTAANETARRDPDAALIVAAPSDNPFDDAELHRIAALVSANGTIDEVMPATITSDDGLARSTSRLRLLGYERAAAVPAGFAAGFDFDRANPEFDSLVDHGPLVSDAAVARIIGDRVKAALHELVHHGDDGIEAGLDADHGHGYAHSHAVDGGSGEHSHSHSAHSHEHAAVHHDQHEHLHSSA